ncbi:MAG: hypothetical protein GQ532_11395 [Methylomarinum sp.]|nr:hypothetical protein [Methylomarinum sp.]
MRILSILVLLIPFYSAHADIVLIGNVENELKAMTKKEVRDVFLGRSRSLPNGRFALPLDVHELRSEFYSFLTSRSIEQINAYWARIMFSGQALPPLKLPDSQAVIKVVTENKGAIGYVDKNSIEKNNVRILLILK